MRLPWLQVDQDAFERAAELAAVLDINEAQAMGHLVFLWRWSLSRPGDVELSGEVQGQTAVTQVEAGARWKGRRGAFVEVLIELGLVTEDGANLLRVRGLDRYRKELTKREQDRERQAVARAAARHADVQRTSNGQPADVERQTQTQTQTQKKKEQLPLSAQAAPEADPRPARVFEHWRAVMGKNARTAFDAKRQAAVEARLRDGYTVEDLCLAVDGCAATPHNMGQNDRGERYDDLGLICRDAAHVDRFVTRARQLAPPRAARPDEDAFREVLGLAQGVDPQLPRMLAGLTWSRDGEGLLGHSEDPYVARWLLEHHEAWLTESGVRLEFESEPASEAA